MNTMKRESAPHWIGFGDTPLRTPSNAPHPVPLWWQGIAHPVLDVSTARQEDPTPVPEPDRSATQRTATDFVDAKREGRFTKREGRFTFTAAWGPLPSCTAPQEEGWELLEEGELVLEEDAVVVDRDAVDILPAPIGPPHHQQDRPQGPLDYVGASLQELTVNSKAPGQRQKKNNQWELV
jgi:hypothetical protein